MAHIKEELQKHPQLEELLKPEFDEETWKTITELGAPSRFLFVTNKGFSNLNKSIPNVWVEFEADPEKPLTFEKEINESVELSLWQVTYIIKNA